MAVETTKLDPFGAVEVSAEAILPLTRALKAKGLANILLATHELSFLEKGHFYPLSNYLELLGKLEERMPDVLRGCGEYICQEAIFPPDLVSFEQLLAAEDEAYLMNHRGYADDEIGHYNFERRDGNDFFVTNTVPYPCLFDIGIFHGFASKTNNQIVVEHVDTQCRSKGASCCRYRIRCLD